MYCNNCESNPCSCRKSSGGRPLRETMGPRPEHGITKEQFGLNLYDAIHTIGGILQLQHFMGLSPNDSQELNTLRARELAQRKELARLLPLLTDDEDRQLRTRYPEVLTW